jgi:predicted oxidoreductase
VSRLVWGSMRSLSQFGSAAELAAFLGFLLDRGVTTIDTADIYGSYRVEAFLGEALKLLGPARRQFGIVTKAGIALLSERRPDNRIKHYNSSAAYLKASLDASIMALGIEPIDLWLIHRPDPLMEVDETARALEDAVAEGKARHVGVSNFRPSQVELLHSRLSTPIATNQIEFSLLHLDPIADGSFDIAQRLGFRPQIWSPLAAGRLLSAEGERPAAIRAALDLIAVDHGLQGPGEAALAWIGRHPTLPVPVVGSGKRERIDAALKALEVDLDRQSWYAVLQAATGAPVP